MGKIAKRQSAVQIGVGRCLSLVFTIYPHSFTYWLVLSGEEISISFLNSLDVTRLGFEPTTLRIGGYATVSYQA